MLKHVTIGLCSLLFLAACTTTNNVSSYNRESNVPGNSAAKIKQAIVETGKKRRWSIKNTGSNRILAMQTVPGGISATTEITYSSGKYKFRLVNSTGLSQKGTAVHRRYNNWIAKWDSDIKKYLFTH